MNFTSLSYFETLAHERSFTRAAQRLHITQQSLSTSIAKLEAELDCQLVVRHVPLELTYAGEVLLRYAASFREGYAAMQQEFCDILCLECCYDGLENFIISICTTGCNYVDTVNKLNGTFVAPTC